VPATGWVPPAGYSPETVFEVGDGVRALDPQSAQVAQLQADGVALRVIRSPGTEQFLTTWKYTVAPDSMLQVVMPVDPATLNVPFALWVQDRNGEWTSVGTTSVVDGQVVMPVLLFDSPGVYQVVATSMDAATQARAATSTPTWGKTTIRTIVMVNPRQMLGTKMCPNTIAFDNRSAVLSKKSKRQIRRLAECLGAMPKITVTGYVGQAIRPKAAKRMAYLRARNVRNYLRDLGYDGTAKVKRTIVERPKDCEFTDNRCSIVRLDVGKPRSAGTPAADQGVETQTSATSSPPIDAQESEATDQTVDATVEAPATEGGPAPLESDLST